MTSSSCSTALKRNKDGATLMKTYKNVIRSRMLALFYDDRQIEVNSYFLVSSENVSASLSKVRFFSYQIYANCKRFEILGMHPFVLLHSTPYRALARMTFSSLRRAVKQPITHINIFMFRIKTIIDCLRYNGFSQIQANLFCLT